MSKFIDREMCGQAVDLPESRLIPDPEVGSGARRRRFSAAYKARIVEEAQSSSEPGHVGALLRREGLLFLAVVEVARAVPQRRAPGASG